MTADRINLNKKLPFILQKRTIKINHFQLKKSKRHLFSVNIIYAWSYNSTFSFSSQYCFLYYILSVHNVGEFVTYTTTDFSENCWSSLILNISRIWKSSRPTEFLAKTRTHNKKTSNPWITVIIIISAAVARIDTTTGTKTRTTGKCGR